jgi:hypothetical protein
VSKNALMRRIPYVKHTVIVAVLFSNTLVSCTTKYTLFNTINGYDYRRFSSYELVFTDSTNITHTYNSPKKPAIKLLVNTLKHSVIIRPNDIGSKASKESYFLTFHSSEEEFDKLRISKTPDNYGIISPGERYYLKNDRLIFVLDSLIKR